LTEENEGAGLYRGSLPNLASNRKKSQEVSTGDCVSVRSAKWAGQAVQDEEEPRKELAEVWNHKGENHLSRREYERAKRAFAKAVEIKPEFAQGWYNLAKAHSHKGEKGEAMAKLKRAIKLDPGYREKARTENLFKKLKGEKEFDRLIK
jgi:tetratricopeptide (TPR) repeat protein